MVTAPIWSALLQGRPGAAAGRGKVLGDDEDGAGGGRGSLHQHQEQSRGGLAQGEGSHMGRGQFAASQHCIVLSLA